MKTSSLFGLIAIVLLAAYSCKPATQRDTSNENQELDSGINDLNSDGPDTRKSYKDKFDQAIEDFRFAFTQLASDPDQKFPQSSTILNSSSI
ncbi:MAG: hypothetical protein HRU09_12970 [Oligoflexales bacterium]|nr:hypothetical protein [Oligoflexales bacterium]